MASGPVSRIDRPNTWLLRPALRRDQSLDNPEPSTHGPKQDQADGSFQGIATECEQRQADGRSRARYRK